MPNYRKPTDKETEKLNKSRKMMVEGIEGEKDLLSKISTTMAKDARDQIRAGKALRETVPASAREGEAYQDAGYKKGGKVKKMRKFEEGGLADESVSGDYLSGGIEDESQKMSKYFPRLRNAPKAEPMDAVSAAQKAKRLGLKPGSKDYRMVTNQAMGRAAEKSLDDLRSGISATNKRIVNAAAEGALGPVGRAIRDRGLPTSYEQDMGMKKGGKVSSASKRADGCAIRGKTRA